MSQTIRWVHLSDFHFGRDEYGEEALAESILEHIKGRPDGLPDLIFITGDLAFSGKSEEYTQFDEQFFQPLTNLLGANASERIFAIPGNHDLDRKTHELIPRSMLQEKRPRFFDPSEEGREQRKEIIERFDSFIYANCNTNSDAWVETKEGVFVRQLKVNGIEVGLLGLNTAWHCQDNHDYEEISPGANLVRTGLRQIDSCGLRVVLGHHPVEWFHQDERASIERLFRDHRVVYLHGHMHKSEAQWRGWPGNDFLTVQAGAAFQAREDEKWKNRILYAEADLSEGKLWVEPFTWSRKEGWVHEGGDAFPNVYYEHGRWGLPLPGHAGGSSPDIIPLAPPSPDGWLWLDADFLRGHRKPPDKATVLAYYDGRIPSWPLALSPDVPHRGVVSTLVQGFLDQQATGRSAIHLITGAGGEGKSTASMQIIAELVDRGWRVLWRRSDVKGLPQGFVQSLPESLGPWLIATDDADVIAPDLYENARAGVPHVHFLFVARDTDWNTSIEDPGRWRTLQGYRIVKMNGLNEEDASLVVDAWRRHGKEGMGDLANTPREAAIQRLVAYAQDQDTRNRHDGAFLGAMLQLRKGTELREHVASMLNRLAVRTISSRQDSEKKTLLDALAYISAMHSENLLFLSKPVLASVLGCNLGKLKNEVLGPLGEEAAAGSCGNFILSRHRAIAESSIELLQQRFHRDTEELYIDMARAAHQLTLNRDPGFGAVPSVEAWRYLSDTFFERGQKELGIRLAMNLVDVEPTNPFLLSKLASLYRKYGQPEQAVEVFRASPPMIGGNRAFYHEWAVCEGVIGNYALGAWIDGLSLANQADRSPLGVNTAPISLAGLSRAYHELFSQYPNERTFIEGCGAAAQLGLMMQPTGDAKIDLDKYMRVAVTHGVTNRSPEDALGVFNRVISLAWNYREIDLPERLPDHAQLEFTQLAALTSGGHWRRA